MEQSFHLAVTFRLGFEGRQSGGQPTAIVVRETQPTFVKHYHGERNHQGIDNRLISGSPAIQMTSRVRRRPRLGGWLNFYEREARSPGRPRD